MSDLVLRDNNVEADALHSRIRRLESDLQDALSAKHAAEQKLRESQRGLRAIKQQLEPWYEAMRSLFGDMEAAGVTATASSSSDNAKWEHWKTRLSGKAAEFIDLLLINGEMSTAQLAAATKIAHRTAQNVIYEMNRVGIVAKNGTKHALKNQ